MILVSLGSNQGDSAAAIRAAMDALAAFAAADYRCSSLWRTSPVDCPPGSPPFVNAAVAFVPVPDLTPHALLGILKGIERRFGRTAPAVRNAPRELDLDLVLFADVELSDATLTLPHPRAHLRRFVLAPAAEIAPEMRWPGLGQTVGELNATLVTDEVVERL